VAAKKPNKNPRRGVGNNPNLIPGNPGNSGGKKGRSGRPPSALREQLRGSFAERIPVLEQMVDDAKTSASDRLRALDLMAKYGLGTTSTSTNTDGQDAPTPGKLTPEEIEAEVKRIMNGE
jgi:hypothetical protein